MTERAALSHPIESEKGDLRRLLDANESVHETRTRFLIGRANVYQDVVATDNVGRNLVTAVRHFVAIGPDVYNRLAAAALAVGAGNCTEYKGVSVRIHAPKLQSEETISAMGIRGLDHVWGLLVTPGRPTITLDAWANGPAMETVDTLWHTPWQSPCAYETFNAHDGTAVKDRMVRQAEVIGTGAERPVLTDMLMQSRDVEFSSRPAYMKSCCLAETASASKSCFGDCARAHLQYRPPLHQEILTVGALRDGYGLNIAAAAAQAQPALEAARTLDTLPDELARPPVRKPPR